MFELLDTCQQNAVIKVVGLAVAAAMRLST